MAEILCRGRLFSQSIQVDLAAAEECGFTRANPRHRLIYQSASRTAHTYEQQLS